MFEGSLVESRGIAVSRAQRWSAVGSAVVQLMLAALVVIIPLMRPQTMKIFTQAPHLAMPPLHVRPPQVVHVNTSNTSAAGPAAPSLPTQPPSGIRIISIEPGIPTDTEQPGPLGPIAMGGTSIPSLAPGGGGPTVSVTRAVEHATMAHLSGGITTGMLLAPIQPVYPHIAVMTKTQGSVVVEAMISKAGRIESAHVTSGPPMLRQAALDAVAAARYRPYLLSGEPVEVETTITVVFKLGE